MNTIVLKIWLVFMYLALTSLLAGTVSDYVFSSSSGIFAEICGGTTHGSNLNDNDNFPAIPLGFSFTYNGISYSDVSIQTNGFIAMGSTVVSSNVAISSVTGTNNIIAALNRDLKSRDTGSLISLTSGTAPNRVFTVQWLHYRRVPTTTANDDFSFQIQLHEGTNVIQFVYGPFTAATAYTASTTQVGLRGESNTDFNNRATTADWSTTTAGTANNSTCTLSSTVFPVSGQTFTWTPYNSEQPPSAAVIGTPLNNASQVLLNSSLQWQSGEGYPTGFRLFFGTDNPPTNIENGTNMGNAINYDPTPDLNLNTTYYWKIVPYNDYGDALNCPVWSFTTYSQPPENAQIGSPSNGATNVLLTPELHWTLGGGYPSGCKMYLGTNNPPSNLENGIDLGMETSYQVSTLLSLSTTFYWQIVPYNQNGSAVTCPIWSFTTGDVPHPANNIAPLNTAVDIPLHQTMQWVPGTGDNPPTGYKLYLGTDSPPSNLVNGMDLGLVTSYAHSSLFNDATQYTWKIVPYNEFGEAESCPVWTFTTGVLPQPANLLYPEDAATGICLLPSLSVQFVNPTHSGFRLHFGTDNPPTNVFNGYDYANWSSEYANFIVGTSLPSGHLELNTTYYWSIVPYNQIGVADSCPVWSFTTEASLSPQNVTVYCYDEEWNEIFGADVFFDDVYVGTTPLYTTINPDESHVVTLYKFGWTFAPPWYQSNIISYDYYSYPISIGFLGTPNPYEQPNPVTITSDPPGAYVIIDGQWLGTTPMETTIDLYDTYYVSAWYWDYVFTPESIEVTWSPGESHNIHFTGVPAALIQPPIPPETPFPVNQAINVETAISCLGWYCQGIAPVAGCNVYFGLENPPPLLTNVGGDHGSYAGWAYPVTEPLQSGTTYYWKIVPFNEYGECPNSPVWSFHTIEPNHPTHFTAVNSGITPVVGSNAEWGDFNNDNHLDLILAGEGNNQEATYLFQNDNGNFSNVGTTDIGYDGGAAICSSLNWGDYNNDNSIDYVISGEDVTDVFHNVNGQFTPIIADLDNPLYSYIKWCDVDNDGTQDLVLNGGTEEYVNDEWIGNTYTKIFHNERGNFIDNNQIMEGGFTGALDLGDYDNDGDMDILLSGYSCSVSHLISRIFRNDEGVFSEVNSIIGTQMGSVSWGDYDNDGDLDILISGISYLTSSSLNSKTTKIYQNINGNFYDINAAIPAMGQGHAAWGDMDNDGDLDVVITGLGPLHENNSQRISQIYLNNNGTFTDTGAKLTPLGHSVAALGDYDNDLDLDILLSGGTGQTPYYYTDIFQNSCPIHNTAPTAPTNLRTEVIGSYTYFYWDAATDQQTPSSGLTYNLRIGTTPSGNEILSSMSAANGFRKVATRGFVNANCFWKVKSAVLDTLSTWYWSVQAIDTSFIGSPFAPDMAYGTISADFSADQTNVPLGTTIQFTDLSTGNPNTWQWDFDSNGSIDASTQNPTYTFEDPGVYTVLLTASNEYSQSTEVKTDYITVYESQNVFVTSEPTGAKVFIDGLYEGLTPFTASINPDESFTVSVQKLGYSFSPASQLVQWINEPQSVHFVGTFTNPGTVVYPWAYPDVWTIDDSPYNIVDSIAIAADRNITIQEGVEVLTYKSASLPVYGSLNATRAIFKPVLDSQVWNGLEIIGSDSTRTISYLNSCQILNSSSPLKILNCSPVIDSLQIALTDTTATMAGTGIIISGEAAPFLNEILIINYETGIQIVASELGGQSNPSLSNIRIRNTNSSVRNLRFPPSADPYGIKILGSSSAVLSDIKIDDYLTGIIIANESQTTPSNPSLSNIRIRNTSSSVRTPSRGIVLNGNQQATIDDCQIDLYNLGVVVENDIPLFTSNPSLSNIRIRNTNSSVREAAIGIFAGENTSPVVENCEIWESDTALVAMANSQPQISNNLIRNCTTGVRSFSGLLPQLHGNLLLVETNWAAGHPELSFVGLDISSHPSLTVQNNTFYGYSTLMKLSNSYCLFENNIAWHPSPLLAPFYRINSNMTASYNDVFAGPDAYLGVAIIGNLNIDPLFFCLPVNNFHLHFNSPCIDSGNPASALDADGSRADMGAYPYLHNADFTLPETNISVNTPVTFTNYSLGHDDTSTLIQWDLGVNGSIESGERNWGTSFSEAGSYSLQLTMITGNLFDQSPVYQFNVLPGGGLDAPVYLQAWMNGGQMVISWDAVLGAQHYKVLASDDPNSGFTELSPSEGSFSNELNRICWTTNLLGLSKRFYRIIAVND